MSLFLVHAVNSNGDSMEWFVRAENFIKALEAYAGDEVIRAMGPTEGGVSVHQVPDTIGRDGVVDWSEVVTDEYSDEVFRDLANYEDDE